VIEGTYLGVEHMSVRKGGEGGTIINISSFGGITDVVLISAVRSEVMKYCAGGAHGNYLGWRRRPFTLFLRAGRRES
jgi:hypothetical protein